MFWLLIEGDNGTGKDTLRTFFEREGWLHVNGSSEALSELRNARECSGCDRIPGYLRYCQTCGLVATESSAPAISVRYWPSTLAAGYADHLMEEDELDHMLEDCRRRFPDPDGVIELRCRHEARVQRIEQRIPEPSGHPDNLDLARARRHGVALNHIASKWGLPWLVIDTTSLEPAQVFKTAHDWVQDREG